MINLKVKQLSKQLDKFQLTDLNFEIEAGTVMGFVGENGAGKTSTIHCILQLLKPDSGTVEIFGEPYHVDATDVKQQIGVVFDSLHFPDTMEVKALEQLYANMYKNWDQAYFDQLLTRLNVSKTQIVKKMSAGTQKKLTIALALAYRPKLLLLDEPTSQLDAISRDEVTTILAEFMESGDQSILFSSHITSDLEKIADTITLIHDGRVAFSENKDDLLYKYHTFKGSIEQSLAIPKEAIVSKRDNVFGVEVLVKRELVPTSIPLQKPDLENVLVLFMKQLKHAQMVKNQEAAARG